MYINIFIFTFVAIWPTFCDDRINCHVYNDTNDRHKGGYCVYALKEDGTQRRGSNDSFIFNFKVEDTPMNKCIKPPGLAAFKRCDTHDWCNRDNCTGVKIVPWPDVPPQTTTFLTEATTTTLPTTSITSTSTAATTTLATVTTKDSITTSTILSPTTFKTGGNSVVVFIPDITNEQSEPPLKSSTKTTTTTTPEAVTTKAPTATRTTSSPNQSPVPPSNGTSIKIIGPNCETGKQNNQNGPLRLPLTNMFDNEQVNVVYNIPSSSNNCECRCGENEVQNNLFVWIVIFVVKTDCAFLSWTNTMQV